MVQIEIMLYIHSFGSVEQVLGNLFNLQGNLCQVDARQISSHESLDRIDPFGFDDVLFYSFLNLHEYRFLDTFRHELERVHFIVDYVKRKKFRKLIILTAPGAFDHSDNLYLQHKGLIEQKFQSSGIPCLFLRVQAVTHAFRRIHNLHHLFYERAEGRYLIPQKNDLTIYSIQLDNLHDIVEKAMRDDSYGYYDAFDSISKLPDFLKEHAAHIPITRIAPLYLYFKSYLGNYLSPSILELFLRPVVPMYSYRTAKAFGVKLHQEETTEEETLQLDNPRIHLSPVFQPGGWKWSKI